MTEDTALKLVIILVLIGIVDASYLCYLHSVVEGGGGCSTRNLPGLDCGEVIGNEKYNKILDVVPVAWVGLFGFIIIFILSFDRFVFMDLSRTRYHRLMIPVFSAIGLIFSLYLTYLELFVIHEICPFCFIGFIIISIITFLSLLVYKEYLTWLVNVKLFKRRKANDEEGIYEIEERKT